MNRSEKAGKMKNITLSADEHLIEAANQRAAEEHTTLNEQFQLWLKHYVHHEQQVGPSEAQGTLADFLQGHIGILHSNEYMLGGARMSVDSGKKFAEGLLKKRQQEE